LMIVISGFVGYRTQNEPVKLNDLCMANIEALSHSEGNGYETVSELYEFRKTILPDGTVNQEWIYLGKNCSGRGILVCA
ncbi:NVEALA domain-containing protein, partial [uncultured Duncaniella sp.]|uniref:NVEALA domain-containing protein n=1 Tax=uncultured Duncaniella sp. TaxID=2768039 RepID=UPI00259CBBAC